MIDTSSVVVSSHNYIDVGTVFWFKKYIGDQENIAKLDLLMILHEDYPLYSDFW